jgi:hypothetical protein
MTSAHKNSSTPLRNSAAEVPFRVQEDFFVSADRLRLQLEEGLISADHAGITPLTYVFSENRYSFLATAAADVFAPESIDEFIHYLGNWGRVELGVSHVSSPQVRVFTRGCGRELLTDAVVSGWHYVLCLTRGNGDGKNERVRIVAPTQEATGLEHLHACDLVTCELKFNRLLVHDSQAAYAIDSNCTVMNPLQASVLLDGYLW